MDRRHFITLAGAGAMEISAHSSYPLPMGDAPPWELDGAGSLGRIGVLTPHFDPVPESEMWAMAPPGVSIHASRVTWSSGPRAFAEPPHVDRAAELLAGLAPRVILYGFTSSSYVLGRQADDSLRARLEKRAGGIPVILTCSAATEALRILGAHRIAVIHPPWFTEELNATGMDYFQAQGFETVLCARITPARPFTEVPPAELYRWARSNVPRHAEAVFVGGNGLRAIGAIHALEESLRRPVLTANQVLFWQALRLVGAASKVTRYGRLFTKGETTR
jgi:maleate isomerase